MPTSHFESHVLTTVPHTVHVCTYVHTYVCVEWLGNFTSAAGPLKLLTYVISQTNFEAQSCIHTFCSLSIVHCTYIHILYVCTYCAYMPWLLMSYSSILFSIDCTYVHTYTVCTYCIYTYCMYNMHCSWGANVSAIWGQGRWRQFIESGCLKHTVIITCVLVCLRHTTSSLRTSSCRPLSSCPRRTPTAIEVKLMRWFTHQRSLRKRLRPSWSEMGRHTQRASSMCMCMSPQVRWKMKHRSYPAQTLQARVLSGLSIAARPWSYIYMAISKQCNCIQKVSHTVHTHSAHTYVCTYMVQWSAHVTQNGTSALI